MKKFKSKLKRTTILTNSSKELDKKDTQYHLGQRVKKHPDLASKEYIK